MQRVNIFGQGTSTVETSPAQDTQRRVERISQSVIRVLAKDASGGFDHVRSILLNWLREKAGRELPDAMLRGETDCLDLLGAQRVETVALVEPILWSARQDFFDRTVLRRTWITEAMLAAEARSLLLGFRLHCVTLGEPAPFSRSVPRFMRSVASVYSIELDGVEIDLQAQLVETDEEVDALVQLLTNPQRRSPVIGVSTIDSRGEEKSLVEADRLANALIGTAHVRILSRQASFSLTNQLGKRFSVFNGATRVWQPNLQLRNDDPYDHPLWLAERIVDEGEPLARAGIIDRVLRTSAGRRDADQAIPSFAEARRTESTIRRKLASDGGGTANDLIPLYESENLRLTEDLRDTKAFHAELVALADEELRVAKLDRDEARSEIHNLRARLNEMAKALEAREQKPIVQIPDSFEGFEAWATLYITEEVELLPRAITTAEKSAFDNPPLAYQALLLMKEAYVPMRRSGSQVLKDRWIAGLQQLGLECSPTHSSTRAGENASDYFVPYRGRKRELDMHLKGSNSRDPRYCFRLYFFYSDEARKVVVGSLPSHLDTRIS